MSISPKVILLSGMTVAAAAAWSGISLAQPVPVKMKDCLLIEDGYKERLDCYDAVIAPQPRPGAKKGKAVTECRYLKEEDERLSCYNGFVASQAKPQPAGKSTAAGKKMPPVH